VAYLPLVEIADAIGPLPVGAARFDCLAATVAVRSIPGSWLTALRPWGQLVTTLAAGTSLIVTVNMVEDGGAVGRVEWDRAGSLPARHGPDYLPSAPGLLAVAQEQDGETVILGPYPVVDVANDWDLNSMLALTAPGIEHAYHATDTRCTAAMAHADGSWARVTAVAGERPTVHQGGPPTSVGHPGGDPRLLAPAWRTSGTRRPRRHHTGRADPPGPRQLARGALKYIAGCPGC